MKPSKYRNVRVEPSESQSQAAVIQWWALACKGYRLPEHALFSIPNGANKSPAARMKFKREGLRAGVPDLFLAAPHPVQSTMPGEEWLCGLFIEMKKKPNKISAEQADFIYYLRTRGYHVCVCYSADEAIKAISGYLA